MVQVCMKLMGSLMIILGGTICGVHYGNCIQKRYEELLEWRRIFEIIQTDISYGGRTLLEIIQHIKIQEKNEIRKLFTYMELNICEKKYVKMEDMWKMGIHIYGEQSSLKIEDIEELIKILSDLGSIEKQQQLRLIQLYVNQLETKIHELEIDKNKKRKLCHTLGILGSIFLVVLLI